jgi:hypothetical protein
MRKAGADPLFVGASLGATLWLGRCWHALTGISTDTEKEGASMVTLLWIVLVIILIAWLLGGFVVRVGGSLIHLLLVVALIILIYNLLTGRRAI